MKPATFVVLGNPRGGTSAVAGLLRIFGIHMGVDVAPYTHEDRGLRGRYDDTLPELIAERNSQRDVWGWKDPQLVDHIGAVEPHLRNPRFLVVTRDPADVAMSEQRNTHRDLSVALQQARRRLRSLAEFAAHRHDRTLVVAYEDLMGDTAATVARIARWVGVDPTSVTLDRARLFLSGGYRTLRGRPHHGPLPNDTEEQP